MGRETRYCPNNRFVKSLPYHLAVGVSCVSGVSGHRDHLKGNKIKVV